MADDAEQNQDAPDDVAQIPEAAAPQSRKLSPAAMRALEEAEARRKAALQAQSTDRPNEINGPRGLEPTRYGDWERKGVASDF